MGATVLVVGAGRFGAHYVRILAGMNRNPPAGVAPIRRLVVSRTRPETARQLARRVQRDPECAGCEVVGVSVAGDDELVSVLERFDPLLTCITATDAESGDALHAVYSEIVLRRSRGRLLCEKPLCPATGDGTSLDAVRRLRRTGEAGRFGLELPMTVVRRKMETHPVVGRRLAEAGRFRFLWSTTSPLRSDLADALALHPWSMLPDRLLPERIESRSGASRFEITGRLADPRSGRSVELGITLRNDANDRVMTLDGIHHVIDTRGAKVTVHCDGDTLLAVENPLRQNIAASLAGAPTDGLSRAAESQRFLEMVKGWKNT